MKWLVPWWDFRSKIKALLVVRHVREMSRGIVKRNEKIVAWNQGMGAEDSYESSGDNLKKEKES